MTEGVTLFVGVTEDVTDGVTDGVTLFVGVTEDVTDGVTVLVGVTVGVTLKHKQVGWPQISSTT